MHFFPHKNKNTDSVLNFVLNKIGGNYYMGNVNLIFILLLEPNIEQGCKLLWRCVVCLVQLCLKCDPAQDLEFGASGTLVSPLLGVEGDLAIPNPLPFYETFRFWMMIFHHGKKYCESLPPWERIFIEWPFGSWLYCFGTFWYKFLGHKQDMWSPMLPLLGNLIVIHCVIGMVCTS